MTVLLTAFATVASMVILLWCLGDTDVPDTLDGMVRAWYELYSIGLPNALQTMAEDTATAAQLINSLE